jgi:hypothetical protein
MDDIPKEGQYVPYITAGLGLNERDIPANLTGLLKEQQ